MSAHKSSKDPAANDPAQQAMAEKGRQAQEIKHSQPNDITQETNMKRQQKNTHEKPGK
jgi:hypothetical protein